MGLLNLPVTLTTGEIPRDLEMKPYGPITKENPYKQCLPDNHPDTQNSLQNPHKGNYLASHFGNTIEFGDTIELEVATYQQQVDRDYAVILEDHILPENQLQDPEHIDIYFGTGLIKHEQAKDNEYVDVMTLNQVMLQAKQICLHIIPLNENPVHPLTIWLNSQNLPVLRIRTHVSIIEALQEITEQNTFNLGNNVLFTLCLAYFVGLLSFLGIIFYAAFSRKAPQPAQKSSHHPRAGHKRV